MHARYQAFKTTAEKKAILSEYQAEKSREQREEKRKIDRQRRIPLDVAKEQLDRIREGLDHFGQEYAGKDKAAQTLKFTRCVEYLESVTVRS